VLEIHAIFCALNPQSDCKVEENKESDTLHLSRLKASSSEILGL